MDSRIYSIRMNPYFNRLMIEFRRQLSLNVLKGRKCTVGFAVTRLLECWLDTLPPQKREELMKVRADECYDYDEEERQYQEEMTLTRMIQK